MCQEVSGAGRWKTSAPKTQILSITAPLVSWWAKKAFPQASRTDWFWGWRASVQAAEPIPMFTP